MRGSRRSSKCTRRSSSGEQHHHERISIMGKSLQGDSRRVARELSALIKTLAARIGSALEHDLASNEQERSHPGLVSHFTRFSTASGLDSIQGYADELAQAAFFHFLAARVNGGQPTRARFLPGLESMLAALYEDPAVQAELATYSIDQFSDEFHEAFLKLHAPGTKKKRGIFYTPAAAARFMVRGVDELLKTCFGIPSGLLNDHVKIVDPACGTGAFLIETCKALVSTGQESSAKRRVLDGVEGHDIMLSSLVFCEMQLARMLAAAGLRLHGDEALNLRQLNSLTQDPANELAVNEGALVIVGNPPYAVSSANKNEFIAGLMADYKAGLKERNIQPLSDDYIKFMRAAQWSMEQARQGIVAFVTNNAYIYKMIYRRMRESLMATFDDIYIINLHGNVNIGEKTPAGDPDGSIFNIRVGTCIVFMVKSGSKKEHQVHYHELFGTKDEKLGFLDHATLPSIPFEQVTPAPPAFFFIKKDMHQEAEYEKHPSIKDIFQYFTIGVKTHRDDFIVELNRSKLESKVKAIAGDDPVENIKERYRLNDSTQAISGFRARIRAEGIQDSCFITYLYRPFDQRVLYFSPSIITRHRLRVMKHMFHQDNIALVTTRLLSTADFCHCMVSRDVGDIGLLSSRTSESAYFFPLYLYDGKDGKGSNIKPGFMSRLASRYPGVRFTPEMILGYVYAMLHAPWYRRRYAEMLKSDFPRIPLARDAVTFEKVATAGEALVSLHLSWPGPPAATRVAGHDGERVERFVHDATRNRVIINDSHEIAGISPSAWTFKIGNYAVLQKWLRGRKGTMLSREDESTFIRIARVLDETMDIARAIEAEFPRDPGEGTP